MSLSRRLSTLPLRLRSLLRRRHVEDELEEELRDHLIRKTEEYAGRGYQPKKALEAARRDLGGLDQAREACRDARGVAWLETTIQDARYGLRVLRKSPGFAATAILMLALGIGANTTIFCWIQTIVWNPLPGVAHSDRLVAIVPAYRGTVRFGTVSYPDFQEVARLSGFFRGVLASSFAEALLTIDGKSEWVFGRIASANVFDVLGVRPERGRFFLPDEDRGEGGHPVVVVSHALWQRRFAGDPDIVGRVVLLNQHPFEVIGITPREFQGVSPGFRADFWAPLSMHQEILSFGSFDSRTFRWVTLLGRLRGEASAASAGAATRVLSRRLARIFPDTNRDLELQVYPLWRSPVGNQAEFLPILRLLLAVSVAVLSIVVVNVANLLLARATSREREMALRQALGGRRLRLVRQLLTESLLLALAGGAVGALLAREAVGLFSVFLPRTSFPVAYEFHLNSGTLAFALALASSAAVVFGIVPALQAGRESLVETLKEGGERSGSQRAPRRLRDLLVIAEVGLALLLLIGAALCLQGLRRARSMDLGLDPRDVLTAQLSLVPNGYTAEQGKIFDRQLRARLAAAPGVSAVGLASALPLGDLNIPTATVSVDGEAAGANPDRMASFLIVSPGYLDTMRIPILAGRDFTDHDDAQAPNVAIVNETMARQFWPHQSPVGRTFHMAAGIAASQTFTVVGVARSGKYRTLSEPPTPLAYLQSEQRPIASLFMGVVLRTRQPGSAAQLLRREIHALDPAVEPLSVETLDEFFQPAFAQVQIGAALLGVLALTALVLACVGLYGVMGYVVAQRTREIGVRVALGASRAHVLRLVVTHALTLVAVGEAAGLVLAAGATRWMESVLYGLSPTDLKTLAGASLLFAVLALLACVPPLWRGIRVDPLDALRRP